MRLTFYKVSEEDLDDTPLPENRSPSRSKMVNLRPKTKEAVEFNISSLLYSTLFSDGKYFVSFMPMTLMKTNFDKLADEKPNYKFMMVGSVVFED